MNSKILYIVFLLFLSYTSLGQLKIRNLSLTKPDSNIIYIGIDNKIQLLGLADLNRIKLTLGEKQSILSNGIFITGISAPGKFEMEVYKGNKQLLSREYIATRVPEPQCGLAYFRDTILSIPQIIAIKTVKAFMPHCILKLQIAVVHFDLSVTTTSGNVKYLGSGFGNTLSPDQIQKILLLHSGDKLNFDSIKISGPDMGAVIDRFYIIIK